MVAFHTNRAMLYLSKREVAEKDVDIEKKSIFSVDYTECRQDIVYISTLSKTSNFCQKSPQIEKKLKSTTFRYQIFSDQ